METTPNTRRRLAIGGLAAAAALTLGIGGVAAAQSSGDDKSESGAQEQDPSYQSSVTAPETEGQSEADEAKALEGVAKISPDEAKAAAVGAVPGSVVQVELDNENGNVVYSVEIDTGNGVTDVKVDAGNGSVLTQETGEDEANEPDEAEGPEEADPAEAGG